MVDDMRSQTSPAQIVVCVRNNDCDDLELRKLYQVLPDPQAAQDGYLRIIDESGEDYLYPASYFVAIILPNETTRQLQELVSLSAA